MEIFPQFKKPLILCRKTIPGGYESVSTLGFTVKRSSSPKRNSSSFSKERAEEQRLSNGGILGTPKTALALYFMQIILLQNTYNILIPSNNGTRMRWAPAILVDADKVSFYKCGFSSLQDTVTDDRGRHLYKNCFIQGAVDFIWGGGQSVFQTCVINVLGTAIGLGPGFITARARGSLEDPSGFVFKFGQVIGTGQTYLGRPYTSFSRVIFYRTNFSPIIVPESGHHGTRAFFELLIELIGLSCRNTVTFVEADCMGEGANKGKRIQWLKKLSTKDLNFFVKSPDFIDKEMWLEKIPLPLTEGN
ncbi:putative pectinesterase 52 [Vitis vinifera]|uniref:putative pectinesterase 52 n=1 Tax=Vitis vinifera TaxID=29760 RepID=UPI00053F7AD8|nr:putative pectinesterase 52 [Vitis vinifera]